MRKRTFARRALARAVGALWLLLGTASATGLAAVPVAHAAGSCDNGCIHWDSSMIYAGQNNGYPEGPVGEHALVHGEGFSAETGQALTFKVVKGDVNNSTDSEFCKLEPTKVPLNGTATPDGSGNFDFGFDWPGGAGSGQWSICAYRAADSSTIFNVDDGPFAVLSSQPPSLSLSKSTVAPGAHLTITGKHWLPAQGNIFVYVGPCADCDGAPVASAMVSSAADGSFSVTLPIPANTSPNSYIASAHTQTGVLDIGPHGPHVKIAIPAPTATPKPTATATSAPTATAVPSAGTGSTSTSGGAGGSATVIALLAFAALLLAVITVLVVTLVRRGKRPQTGPPGNFGGPGGPGGGYGQAPVGAYPPAPGTYPPAGGAYPTPPGSYPTPPGGQTMPGQYGQPEPWHPGDNDAPTIQTPADPYGR
ncbi:MAG TPA: hypothetical protein VFU88_15315 [Ktedonobacterales bacterium]|nr:hypothetical protein [Ktedonobacterales bacterium]